jgi:AcrR family transcriptional regulator
MQVRSEATRAALIRATAELIADGRTADAGLVNICQRAGVTRGALYHHFPSIAALTAAVYEEACRRLSALVDDAFAEVAADRLGVFLLALGEAVRADTILRAGLRLTADRPPATRGMAERLHGRVAETYREVAASPRALADLAVVVTAGLQVLGRSEAEWWEAERLKPLWEALRPAFQR